MYSVDTGLSSTVGFRFSENLSRLAENIVFMALKRKQVTNPDIEIFYWKDTHHREVDFVVKEGLKVKRLLQVCWDMQDGKVRNRELRGLLKAMHELNIDSGMIITEDAEREEFIHGKKIQMVPLWKWLLVEESML